MKRILVIVLAALAAGALVGGIVGVALDNGEAATTTTVASPIANAPNRPSKGLTAEQIYRNDAPGVTQAEADELVPPATAA